MRQLSEVLLRRKQSAYSLGIDDSNSIEKALCVCVNEGLRVKVYGAVKSRV